MPDGHITLHHAQATPLHWLWPGRVAAGRLTLIDGDPGQGKSLLTLDLAARLTRGLSFPDGHGPPAPAPVLILPGGEDDLEDTIIPRLEAAGADLSKVHFWDPDQSGLPRFPADCQQLRDMIEATGSRLVILDPFFAFLGQDVGSLNDLMIRRALSPLAQLAAATGAAFLLVRHLAKISLGKAAACRGLGSMAILGAVRTAFLAAVHPGDPDRRVLACTKNNLGPLCPSLAFRIAGTDADAAYIEWLGPVPLTADDLVQARCRTAAMPRAVRLLEEALSAGWADRQAIVARAAAEGISFRTLERAKAALGVESQQRREAGRNVWYWRLRGS